MGVIFLIIPGTNGYVKPLAQHRSIAYDDGAGGLMSCCNTNPRAAISMDGRYIVFNSNMGVPEVGSLYILDTGYPPTSGGSGMKGTSKITGKAKLLD